MLEGIPQIYKEEWEQQCRHVKLEWDWEKDEVMETMVEQFTINL